MKKTARTIGRTILIVVGVLLLAFGCYALVPWLVLAYSDKTGSMDSPIEGFPMIIDAENKRWGMARMDGSLLFRAEFDSVPTVVRDGRFFVKSKKGLWEMYEARENPTRIGGKYSMVSSFSGGCAIVAEEGQPVSIINTNGEVVKLLDKIDGKEVLYVRPFKDGYARFKTTEGLLGAIDKKGNCVVKPKYLFLSDCGDGKFIGIEEKYRNYVEDKGAGIALRHYGYEWRFWDEEVFFRCYPFILPPIDYDGRFRIDEDAREQVRISVLNTKGEEILCLSGDEYIDVGPAFADGLLAVREYEDGDDAWGIINDKGEVVVKPSTDIKQIGEIKGDKFTYRDDDGWGLMDINGKELIRTKYEALFYDMDNLLLAVSVDEEYDLEWSYIDEDDHTYEDFGGSRIALFSDFDGKHALGVSKRSIFTLQCIDSDYYYTFWDHCWDFWTRRESKGISEIGWRSHDWWTIALSDGDEFIVNYSAIDLSAGI